MSKQPKTYTRLTRAAPAVGSYSSLWLAQDHLMQVQSSGYSERYQRFQFTDIQGFFVTKSQRRLNWNLSLGVMAAIPGMFMVSALVAGETPVFSAIFFAVAAFFLAMNNVLGPSCRVFIVTRVQTARLASLVRQRKTEKVLARLQPLIEAAQIGNDVPPAAQPPAEPPLAL